MSRVRVRTLKEAIDLRDFARITALDLISGGVEFCQQVRRRATQARKSEFPIVCSKCGFPVYLTKNGLTKEYLWAHFGDAPRDCEWFTGKPLPPDDVGALQFGGRQESPLHVRLKNVLGDILTQDSRAADVEIDTRLNGASGFRKPDVRATYAGRPTAFEIQLSSTQLPTILGREEFYLKEGRALIWLAWSPQLGTKSDTPQAFLDICTAHSENLFSLDEETIRRSLEEERLLLRVHWWDHDHPSCDVVPLTELTYPKARLPFFRDRLLTWEEDFKNRWTLITPPTGSIWRDRKYLYSEIINSLGLDVSDTDLSLNSELHHLLTLLLSLERGAVIGTRQRNLTEMLHTFLATAARQPYARIVEHAVHKSGNDALLLRQKTRDLLAAAKATTQVEKHSVEARIVRALFPKWASPAALPPELTASRSAPGPA